MKEDFTPRLGSCFSDCMDYISHIPSDIISSSSLYNYHFDDAKGWWCRWITAI